MKYNNALSKIYFIFFSLIFIFIPVTVFGQTIMIDNDISQGTLGHWSVLMQTGGESRTAFITADTASGGIRTENVLFDYYSYVAIGSQTSAFRLSGIAPQVDPQDSDKVQVQVRLLAQTASGVPDSTTVFQPPIFDKPGARSISTENLAGMIDSNKPSVILTHGLQSANTNTSDLGIIWQ